MSTLMSYNFSVNLKSMLDVDLNVFVVFFVDIERSFCVDIVNVELNNYTPYYHLFISSF